MEEISQVVYTATYIHQRYKSFQKFATLIYISSRGESIYKDSCRNLYIQ